MGFRKHHYLESRAGSKENDLMTNPPQPLQPVRRTCALEGGGGEVWRFLFSYPELTLI